MTLSLYIARRFLKTFLTVFAGFFVVLYLIDMIEQIRAFARNDVSLTELAELALLNTPASVYRILPLVTILASVALFIALARSSELVVIRAAGRSALAALMAPIVAALLIGAVAVSALNPIVAATTKRYEALSSRYRSGEASTVSVTREGLWLRQGGADGQVVINAQRSNPDGTQLERVVFLSFDAAGAPETRWDARSAILKNGAWDLSQVKRWRFGPGTNPERDAETLAGISLPSDLTPERIRDSFAKPASISVWDLPGFIQALERAGFSSRRHAVWLQMELALPLLLAAMVMVGAGFTMRHARSGKTGTMVLLAIAAGFAIFFLRNFAQVLGENGQIPVMIAAWTPPVAAVLLALSLLLHLEDG